MSIGARAGASRGAGVRPRSARGHRSNPVAEHALRAARAATSERSAQPRPRWPFVGWLLGRVLALALLVGAAWVVYDSASSDRFNARSVGIAGNVLLSENEVERIAAVNGANLLWLDRRAAEARLAALPVVERVEVAPILPDRVDVRVVERQPVGFWISGDTTYLVDRDGVVLKALDGASDAPRACAGQPCDPRVATTFPVVVQADGQPVAPGMRVPVGVLMASARLAPLLAQADVQVQRFEWGRDLGLEAGTSQGWRARFDAAGNLEEQVAALQTIRAYLAREKRSADVIDVRFDNRPYFR